MRRLQAYIYPALGKTMMRGEILFARTGRVSYSSFLGVSYLGLTMFARPRATALIAPPKKKRKTAPAIEEISFDFSAREDYLTGFHKRKVQRIKHAKDEAAKKDREDKVAARKIVCVPLLLQEMRLSLIHYAAARRTQSRPREARGGCKCHTEEAE